MAAVVLSVLRPRPMSPVTHLNGRTFKQYQSTSISIISSQMSYCLEQIIYCAQHGQADVWCISHSMIVHLSYLMCQSSHILVSDAANCIAGWLESIKNMWCGCEEVGVSVGRWV